MKRIFSILFAVVLALSLTLVPAAPAMAQPTEVWVDDDYDSSTPTWGTTHFDTIQDGVDAVATGGTVNMAAGTYDEQVEIGKSLTLQGADKDVATVTGTVTIGASDVTVDGFRVEGTVYVNDSVSDITNATISNNYITGDYYGIYVGTNSNRVISQLTISHNEVIGNENKGIGFWKVDWEAGNLHDVTISWNTISNNLNTGISTYGAGPYFIEDNTVSGNAGNGISIKYDDGDVIARNIVTGNDAMGINMHQVTNCTVEDNTVSGHISEMVVTNFWGEPVEAGKGSGIYLHEVSENNIITLNTVGGNQNGILVGSESGDQPSGNSINLNNIAGNFIKGVINTTPSGVDAENNWWGHASGPSGEYGRVNPDGEVVGKGDSVSDNVDWDPWLRRPVWTNPAGKDLPPQ